MVIAEFISETATIEKYYGKDLDEFQRKIWYEELKSISVPRYRVILREVLRTSKFMPKLADILEIHKSLPYTSSNTEQETVECKRCNSEGYITYKKIIENIPYLFAARCTCKNGDRYRYDGREVSENKSRYYIPSIEEVGIGE